MTDLKGRAYAGTWHRCVKGGNLTDGMRPGSDAGCVLCMTATLRASLAEREEELAEERAHTSECMLIAHMQGAASQGEQIRALQAQLHEREREVEALRAALMNARALLDLPKRLCYQRTEAEAALWNADEVDCIHYRVLAAYGGIDRALTPAEPSTYSVDGTVPFSTASAAPLGISLSGATNFRLAAEPPAATRCPHCGGDGLPHPECEIAEAMVHTDERRCDRCGTRWEAGPERCPVCDDPEPPVLREYRPPHCGIPTCEKCNADLARHLEPPAATSNLDAAFPTVVSHEFAPGEAETPRDPAIYYCTQWKAWRCAECHQAVIGPDRCLGGNECLARQANGAPAAPAEMGVREQLLRYLSPYLHRDFNACDVVDGLLALLGRPNGTEGVSDQSPNPVTVGSGVTVSRESGVGAGGYVSEVVTETGPVLSLPDRAVWSCKIGFANRGELPPGSDAPLRQAVSEAFERLTGREDDFCFSGWGATLTESEQAVVAGYERQFQPSGPGEGE